MGENGGKEKGSGAKSFFYVVASIVLIVVVGYNLYLGLTVKKLGVPGIFEAEFGEKPKSEATTKQDEVKQLPSDERTRRQENLQNVLTGYEESVDTAQSDWVDNYSEDNQVNYTQSSIPYIAGYWTSDDGLSYLFAQNGANVTLQEISPIYGVTMAGQGIISGQTITISYQTLLGTSEQASLAVAPDGLAISGAFTDLSAGVSGAIYMYR